MKNDFANQNEIDYVAKLLLPDGESFDSEKIEIIKCNESKDIRACPGSGKTTTLLAKLAVLANKMPFDNNQGICVLTHTNVAINEIKNRLGHKSDILFSYPNHFGTIQSFVDKYLATPFYTSCNSKRINEISNEAFYKATERSFRNKYNQLRKNDLSKKIWHFISGDIKNVFQFRLDLIDKGYVLISTKNGKPVIFDKPKRKGQKTYTDWTEDEKIEVKNWFIETYRNTQEYYGTISYYDAYVIAKEFISLIPLAFNVFSNRFKYVFIDEMQDTDAHQVDILAKIFDRNSTIIQRFGDPHQSIYHIAKPEEFWKPVSPLPIQSSKRFGENIAKVLRTVCIENNAGLVANPKINSLIPHLIIFDKPEEVLPKYCELLTTLEIELENRERKSIWDISLLEKRAIKAVGWVGEPNSDEREAEKLTIKSYFEPFRKDIKKKEKLNYDSLKSFLKKQENATVKDYSDNIIRALLHILSTEKIKYQSGKNRNYTKTSLLDELQKGELQDEYAILTKSLADWSRRINTSGAYDTQVIDEIKVYIMDQFLKIFGITTPNQYTVSFLNNEPSEEISEKELKANNIFEWEKNRSIKIEIATIHSVKGETHAATLLLETYYQRKHESEQILDQIIGIPYSHKLKETHKKETLKMAYVAMSRPKYFLCLAVKRDRIKPILENPEKKERLEKLWKLIDVINIS